MNPIRPNPKAAEPLRRPALFDAALVLFAGAVLAGCGGEANESAVAPAAPPSVEVAAFDASRESDDGPGDARGPATADEGGSPAHRSDASAVPVDPLARTRSGRYVSRAAAERVDPAEVIWIDAGCCSGLDPELPERVAFGMQAVMGNEARVFVVGSDLRQAARLVDRFDRLGFDRVTLVTP